MPASRRNPERSVLIVACEGKGYKMIGLYGQGQGQSKGSKYGVRVRAKCLLIVACESFMRSKSFWPSQTPANEQKVMEMYMG